MGDDVVRTAPGARAGIGQLIDAFEQTGTAQVALMQVPKSEIEKYGAATGAVDAADPRRFNIDALVEKPPAGTVDTDRAVIGRYVFPASMWTHLEAVTPGRGGEIQLTDAMVTLLQKEGLMGYTIDGLRLDAGDKIGYLEAHLRQALSRDDLKAPARTMMLRVCGLPEREEKA